MQGIEKQQSNIMSLLKGGDIKPSGLKGAGLSIGTAEDGAKPEDFLKTLLNLESPESQKAILAEVMNTDPKTTEALLKAMKGEYVDTEVGDGLDKIVLEKELATQNLSPELKSLLKNMKQTEVNLAKEIDIINATGLPVDGKNVIAESENTSKVTKPVHGEITTGPSKQIFVGAGTAKQLNSELLKNVNSTPNTENISASKDQVKTEELNPRIPLNLNMKGQQQAQKPSLVASGADFVQNLNVLSQGANKKVLQLDKNNNNKSTINGYGKAQNNIKQSMFDLSGADFNTKVSVENDFGSKVNVEAISQNNENGSFEFIAANHDAKTPKGFDVVNANTKVLDMSSIDAGNKTELIQKIVNHIEQNKLESSSSLDLLVKHEELGNFRVNVSKTSPNQVDLEIITQSTKGKEFFVRNESEMIKTLDQSGVKLSNFKLVSSSSHSEFSKFSSESKNQGFDMGQNSSQDQSGSKQFQSGNRDSDRRRQLWDQYKEQAEERKSA
jgi:hypothetical protein